MNIIFFDDQPGLFLPLTYTRPIAKLRVGILTIEEKWINHFKQQEILASVSYFTQDHLVHKYPLIEKEENVFINSRFFPTNKLVDFIINNLIAGEAIMFNGSMVAAKCTLDQYRSASCYIKDYNESFISIELTTITDLFTKNEAAIARDFQLITGKSKSLALNATNTVIGNNIFIEEGAKVEAAVLNSETGPIYIGKNAEIMEGSLVRGPFALCEGGVLKMGAKIYGATTIGAYSKIGGEVTNSVIQDYSNKGHDGFLGNSIVGEWCNLGADTNTSNLKNNYSEVKLWSYKNEQPENTGLQFCGLIMGDHSKSGINTMFNTGTMVGVGSNIFGSGFPDKFIPSFSWGGANGFVDYKLDKMFEVAERMMSRRKVQLTAEDKAILTAIFEMTAKYRHK